MEALAIALRNQILDGRLSAGDVLRENALCAEFGVSRHSMRVALASLGHEGLVRHEANRGVFVRGLTADEIEDCFRMRRLLELDAAQAICGDHAALTPARAIAGQMTALSTGSVWTELRDLDLAFHTALVDALGSGHMSRAYRAMLSELQLCFLIEGFKDLDHERVAKEHMTMLEALESGNLAHSQRLLHEHLVLSERDAVTALTRSAQPQPTVR
ncbi:GntR family transcriptional regulator [Rhodococcus sovatensis]|uniref:GntR family transcriptional regulator n=1 Tax=Rhodococcus sovatensis TaxID=1805840 RepID=A0ABZ2PHZ5_9NOCA